MKRKLVALVAAAAMTLTVMAPASAAVPWVSETAYNFYPTTGVTYVISGVEFGPEPCKFKLRLQVSWDDGYLNSIWVDNRTLIATADDGSRRERIQTADKGAGEPGIGNWRTVNTLNGMGKNKTWTLYGSVRLAVQVGGPAEGLHLRFKAVDVPGDGCGPS